jgi:hypothetical protein
MLLREGLDPVEGERQLEIIGCSAESVPSLSNVSVHSGTGTKSDEPSFVTFSTKAKMALFGTVSFHDESGSCAKAGTGSVKVSC